MIKLSPAVHKMQKQTYGTSTCPHQQNKQKPKQTTKNDTDKSAYNVNQSQKATELIAFANILLSSTHDTLASLKSKSHQSLPQSHSSDTSQSPTSASPLPTIKGHLDQSWKNQRSTKSTVTFNDDDTTKSSSSQNIYNVQSIRDWFTDDCHW